MKVKSYRNEEVFRDTVQVFNIHSPALSPPYMYIEFPTDAVVCLQRLVNSADASPPGESALYLPVRGLVTTPVRSSQAPAAVSSTALIQHGILISLKL